MAHEKKEGRITISCTRSNKRDDYITIQVGTIRNVVAICTMSLENYARVVSGEARVECEIDIFQQQRKEG